MRDATITAAIALHMMMLVSDPMYPEPHIALVWTRAARRCLGDWIVREELLPASRLIRRVLAAIVSEGTKTRWKGCFFFFQKKKRSWVEVSVKASKGPSKTVSGFIQVEQEEEEKKTDKLCNSLSLFPFFLFCIYCIRL